MEQLILAIAIMCKVDTGYISAQDYQKECVERILRCYGEWELDMKKKKYSSNIAMADCLKKKDKK